MSERYEIRVHTVEVTAAIACLQERVHRMLAEDGGLSPRAIRLAAAMAEMRADNPAWVQSFATEGVMHFVPGPSLLELVVPLDAVGIPRARPMRLRRIAYRFRALVREVLGR